MKLCRSNKNAFLSTHKNYFVFCGLQTPVSTIALAAAWAQVTCLVGQTAAFMDSSRKSATQIVHDPVMTAACMSMTWTEWTKYRQQSYINT